MTIKPLALASSCSLTDQDFQNWGVLALQGFPVQACVWIPSVRSLPQRRPWPHTFSSLLLRRWRMSQIRRVSAARSAATGISMTSRSTWATPCSPSSGTWWVISRAAVCTPGTDLSTTAPHSSDLNYSTTRPRSPVAAAPCVGSILQSLISSLPLLRHPVFLPACSPRLATVTFPGQWEELVCRWHFASSPHPSQNSPPFAQPVRPRRLVFISNGQFWLRGDVVRVLWLSR